MNFHQSLPDNASVKDQISPQVRHMTRFRSVPYIGHSTWFNSQIHPSSAISSTHNINLQHASSDDVLNSSVPQGSLWNESQNQVVNSFISGSSNWDPVQFSPNTNGFRGKSVLQEAWIQSNKSAANRNSEQNTVNINLFQSNQTKIKQASSSQFVNLYFLE